MDVIVIGGGASGLVAAIKARETGARVTILEKNNKCGKKLLVTGNGRCNYWNDVQEISKYNSNDLEVFKEIYMNKKDEVLEFFDKLGIVPKVINDYYYPYSMQASSILNALLNKLKSMGVNIVLNAKVIKIKKEKEFQVITTDKKYICDKVIVATGSLASLKDEVNSYDLVKDLGHEITPLGPSLVQLVGTQNFYKEWAGVRSDAILTLKENDKVIKEEAGEVQFTDYGISGICVFNLSGKVARGLLNKNKLEIEMNLVPWFKGSKEEFIKWLDKKASLLKNYTVKEILEGFLNYKLVNVILKLAKINQESKYQDIKKEELVSYLRNFKFTIKETKDYQNAQVCFGGVKLTEINPQTMESKIVKGLYITGELLDVDGECGGYNLGFAWMSGMIAGEMIDK